MCPICMKSNAFVIFIIVGKTNVLWACQHSIKMIGFNQKMIGFKYSVITTTLLVKNNNEESVKQQNRTTPIQFQNSL